jgi:hypothetical protein
MQSTGMSDTTCPWVQGNSTTNGAKYIAVEHGTDNGCTVPNPIPTWTSGNMLCDDFAGCKPGYPVKVLHVQRRTRSPARECQLDVDVHHPVLAGPPRATHSAAEPLEPREGSAQLTFTKTATSPLRRAEPTRSTPDLRRAPLARHQCIQPFPIHGSSCASSHAESLRELLRGAAEAEHQGKEGVLGGQPPDHSCGGEDVPAVVLCEAAQVDLAKSGGGSPGRREEEARKASAPDR